VNAPSPGPFEESEIQAHVDGRLDAARAAQLEAWLADKPDEQARLAALKQDRAALAAAYGPIAAEPIPPRFDAGLGAAPAPWRRVAAAIVIFALGAAAGWAGHALLRPAPLSQADMIAEAIGAHRIFVPEVRRPVEVGANEEAHLVYWLSKRVGKPLKTPDLGKAGFKLVGGRLLADQGRPAALIMYENAGGQRITIHAISREGASPHQLRYHMVEGFGAWYWIDGGLSLAVVGRLERDRLREIAHLVYVGLEQR
jgi:anti-sigma factor RsiW